MPGITGFFCKHSIEQASEMLNRMVSITLHEDFYTQGVHLQEELGIYVGYTSLAGSFADCLPVRNETGNLILFLAGECYFDQSDLDDLRRRGHSFEADNASILVHLYEERGEEFYASLNGWYHGLILDLSRGKVTLFNDRSGMRRLYLHENHDAFFFASEAKSLLAVIPELRRIDETSVGEYLVYDCVLENRTFFREVSLLPSGSMWTYSWKSKSLDRRTYYNPSVYENKPKVAPERFLEEFDSVFSHILPRYLRGGRIGMSLTGGLDTRMILSYIATQPDSIPCYTFSAGNRAIFDARIAPKVAAACSQPHTILHLDVDEFLANYERHLERSIWITDGIVSVVNVDLVLFNQMARELSPLRMTGKYGSQVLKNVIAFQDRSPYPGLVADDFDRYLAAARTTADRLNRAHGLSFLLTHEIPWWWNGMLCAETSQVEVRSPFLDNDLVDLLYRGPDADLVAGANLQLTLIGKHNPSLLSIPTNGTHGGTVPVISSWRKRLYRMLMNTDKLCIRERLPYSLTHAAGFVDRFLLLPFGLNRHILGYHDFRRYRFWFRNELSGFLRAVLLDAKTAGRPYWNHATLQRYLADHIAGRGTYLRELRKALQLEMIHRCLIEHDY